MKNIKFVGNSSRSRNFEKSNINLEKLQFNCSLKNIARIILKNLDSRRSAITIHN